VQRREALTRLETEMQLQPWSFGDPANTATRMRGEYAAWLLKQLPELPSHMRRTTSLVDAYRKLTTLMLAAARHLQAAEAAGFDIALIQHLTRAAQQMRAGWEILHWHMVALEVRELADGAPARVDAVTVLLAEQLVEQMVLEIGDWP